MPTKIPWCDETWSPVVGCQKLREGCRFCWSEELHNRRHIAYMKDKQVPAQYKLPFSNVQLMSERLEQPLHWRRKRNIFVCSGSDIFNKDVPFLFTEQIWRTMFDCSFRCEENQNIIRSPYHNFILLTKRPERILEFEQYMRALNRNVWCDNIWMGISISTQKDVDEMMPIFREVKTVNKFVSVEPYLETLSFDDYLDMLKWVIIGCESGKNRRYFDPYWVHKIIIGCMIFGSVHEKKIPIYYKQGYDDNGEFTHDPKIRGAEYKQMPEGLKK